MQPDHDGEMAPMHGMYGTSDADLKVQGRANSLLVFLERLVVLPTTAHVDNKGIIDGLWTVELKFIGPKAKGRQSMDVDLGGGA